MDMHPAPELFFYSVHIQEYFLYHIGNIFVIKNYYICSKSPIFCQKYMPRGATQQCLWSYNGFILCLHKAFSQIELIMIEVNQATQ